MPGSFIPFADCCEAAIEFLLDGIPSVITLGFHHTVAGAYGIADLADLATVIESQLVTPLATGQAPIVHYTNIHLRDLDSVSGAVFDNPLTNVGSETHDPVQNQVCMTVTFLTGVAGRSYRGRNYIAGLTVEELADSKTWAASQQVFIDGLYETFDAALPSVQSEHVVLSRFSGGAPRLSGVATPVIGYRANAQVYTQRRRLT